MSRIFTNAEQLVVIERLIEDHRWARAHPTVPEHENYLVLKAIAAELRAETPQTRNKALDALTFQIESAVRFKSRIGHIEPGHMQAIAEALMAHWTTVRKALEVSSSEFSK